jgi:hypothetical protein
MLFNWQKVPQNIWVVGQITPSSESAHVCHKEMRGRELPGGAPQSYGGGMLYLKREGGGAFQGPGF